MTSSQKEKKRIEWEKKLEVHCDPHYFRENIFLILSQKEKRRKEIGREKKEEEAREHKEKLEVRHDPNLFRTNRAVLTLSQKEQRQRELERGKEKIAREHKEKLEVRVTLLLLTRCHFNPTTEGKEAEGTRT